MDGNGRWAKKRLLPRVAGHKAGVEAVRNIVRAAGDLGIEAMTLYAFSSENWKRPEDEVNDLMGLMKRFILSDLDEFAANDVKLKVIGNWRALAPDVVALIENALERTSGNKRTTLAVALNYGAQDELVRAAHGGGRRRARSPKTRSRRISTPPTCRRSTCSSAPRARCGCRISCCGSRPMPSCISPTFCGRISNRPTCRRRSTILRAAIVVTGDYRT